MKKGSKADPAGIYIHIPFCYKKCPYCDFYSIVDLELKQPFLNALIREIRMAETENLTFDTLYIGGGTPSILTTDELSRIIETTYLSFKIDTGAEITLETNPDTLDLEKLKGYKSLGANRLIIGVQSFCDKNLRFLKRTHTGDDAVNAVKQARKAGFDNIGIDLIYSIPCQDEKTWQIDLKRAVEFECEHISCYMLTYESGTLMEKDLQKKRFKPLPETLACDLFNITTEFLGSNGYIWYEISNFAKDKGSCCDVRSRHNQKYWSSVPYIGLGPSAHSFVAPVRFKNSSDVQKYLQLIEEGKRPVTKKEVLTRKERMTEEVFLGLRKSEGIDITDFEEKYCTNFYEKFIDLLTYLEKEQFLKVTQKRCCLTKRGMLYHNSISAMLTAF